MTYELHPLCTLFPRIVAHDFLALVEDIKANGLRQPIVLHNGMILDGGNRYRACIQAGVEPTFVQYEGDNITSFVLSANLHRRHLSPGQTAAIVASAQDWAKAQPAHRPSEKECNVAPLSTSADRAAQSGASVRTQKMADKVAKESPDLAKKVAHGEVSLPEAIKQITPAKKVTPKKPQIAVVPDAENDSADELSEARHTITELASENDVLKDRLAVAAMDATEEEKTQAAETLAELRERVKTLEAENDALKVSRDTYMNKVSEMAKQIAMWRKRAEKVAA